MRHSRRRRAIDGGGTGDGAVGDLRHDVGASTPTWSCSGLWTVAPNSHAPGQVRLVTRMPVKLSDLRIQAKLSLIAVLPLVTVVVLAAVAMSSASVGAARLELARRMAVLGTAAGDLAAALQGERAGAALVFAESSSPGSVADFRVRVRETDQRVLRYRGASAGVVPPAGPGAVLRRIDGHLAGLDAVRDQVVAAPDAVGSAVVFSYRAFSGRVGGVSAGSRSDRGGR